MTRVPSVDEPMMRLRMIRDGSAEQVSWSRLGDLDWSNFGLVLGAGGATGAAFEAGVLLALSVDHHVRLADATRIVGTSAGSIGAALLSLGFEADDIAAVIVESYEHVSTTVASYGVKFGNDVPTVPSLFRMFRAPSPRLAVTTLTKVLRRQYVASFIDLFKAGRYDFATQVAFLQVAGWPTDRDVRICATSTRTGRMRVFDGSAGVGLAAAVAASCAVPGVMRPAVIDGEAFVDGGVVSPTSAHLLGGRGGPDLVLVLSPMSGGRSRTFTGTTTSRFASRKLAAELRQFAPHQTVVVIEPAAGLSELVIDDALDSTRSRQVLGTSFAMASL